MLALLSVDAEGCSAAVTDMLAESEVAPVALAVTSAEAEAISLVNAVPDGACDCKVELD